MTSLAGALCSNASCGGNLHALSLLTSVLSAANQTQQRAFHRLKLGGVDEGVGADVEK